MKLSVIIPLYNSGKFLETCIDSLLHQDIIVSDYEILIIDDGSTDKSLEVANALADKHNNVFVYSKLNGGVGSARNLGLSLAKGEYLYFIDPDDYLMPKVLNDLLSNAESNKLDILTFISKPTKNVNLKLEPSNQDTLDLSNIFSGEDYISKYNYKNEIWWYIIRRTFIEESKIRFIEDRWMEDAILTAQLFLKAQKIAHLPIDAHRHLIVENSAMSSKEPSQYLKVIDDNRNAAIVFESLIKSLEKGSTNPDCIKRLRTRQQSFVFFLMIRALKSTIEIDQVKKIMEDVSETNAYPFNIFPGIDYKGLQYVVLSRLFNHKQLSYLLFKLFNPLLKLVNNVK